MQNSNLYFALFKKFQSIYYTFKYSIKRDRWYITCIIEQSNFIFVFFQQNTILPFLTVILKYSHQDV
jgi:hypothetical protein